MANNSPEREMLKKKYGQMMKNKKIADMSDNQVLAIVLRLRRNGQL